jgi:hypothetical protein
MKTRLFNTLVTAMLCTALLPSLTLAQSSSAKGKSSEPRLVPVKKAFPFYDLYLGLPPENRDGFRLGYKFRLTSGAPPPQITYVSGATRIPLELASNGLVLNPPNLAMLRTGNLEVAANQPRSSVAMDLEAIVPLSRSIPVAAASNPLTDYTAATRRAGPVAALAPRLTSIRFVGGAGGEAVFADGRRTPLPTAAQGGFLFTPSAPAMRGATTLSFSSAPTTAEFAR